ncbi:MAG: FMN-binding protein [Rhodothalassiaceae bacterium]|nr:MAG: FMN-binding protein [Rhodothalassiaceae bacterium]
MPRLCGPMRVVARLLLVLALAPALAPCAAAHAAADLASVLAGRAAGDLLAGAERIGPVEGDPPAAALLRDGRIVGHAVLTSDWTASIGYSGKPITILLVLDRDGVARHVELIEHHEPIVLIGVPEARIRRVLQGYVGRNLVREQIEETGADRLDIVAGATVTIMVIDDALHRTAVKLARAKGLAGLTRAAAASSGGPRVRLRQPPFAPRSWQDLLGGGAIRRLHLGVADVTAAFAERGEKPAAARPESPDPTATFIDLYLAPANIELIGRNLLGEHEWQALQRWLEPGDAALLVAGRGLYSFKGSGYVRGGIFDRIALVQGDLTIRFRDRDQRRVIALAPEDAPELKEISLFRIRKGSGFDPTQPFRLELLVQRATGPRTKAFVTFSLPYRLPDDFLEPVAPPENRRIAAPTGALASADHGDEAAARTRLWRSVWRAQWPAVAVTIGLLVALTVIFFVQDGLVRRPRLLAVVRYSYLSVVLIWLGFVMNAQLSVVNVFTFIGSLITGFDWGFFLMAPLIFVLWSGVAAGLLLWGRGPFCGWLCPFGALQEITNRLGRLVGIPQIALPFWLNERLWALKYLIFLALLAVSLHSLSLAEVLSEVEPFKTAIILKFDRPWPYVAYAGLLLAIGLVIERFFCRYLCPLGAALAIPDKLSLFSWLKRHRECGNPCQICRHACPTAAIHPDGRINVNECIYCLDCQKLYWDEWTCPHMIELRIRRERRLLRASDSMLTPEQRREKERLLAARARRARQKGGEAGASPTASTTRQGGTS